jgi:hypothetical protein
MARPSIAFKVVQGYLIFHGAYSQGKEIFTLYRINTRRGACNDYKPGYTEKNRQAGDNGFQRYCTADTTDTSLRPLCWWNLTVPSALAKRV